MNRRHAKLATFTTLALACLLAGACASSDWDAARRNLDGAAAVLATVNSVAQTVNSVAQTFPTCPTTTKAKQLDLADGGNAP